MSKSLSRPEDHRLFLFAQQIEDLHEVVRQGGVGLDIGACHGMNETQNACVKALSLRAVGRDMPSAIHFIAQHGVVDR